MLRSMYAGVSGMRSYQTKMDVIGNNIANVSTNAFKAGSVQFRDLLSETISYGQQALATGLGGTNPQQVGLGVSVGRIDTIMSNGALQPTGRELDFALEGNGFFLVSEQPEPSDDQLRFTRDGSFVRDAQGNLTTGNGYRVVGWSYYEDQDTTDDFTIYNPRAENLEPVVESGELPVEFDAAGDPEFKRRGLVIPETIRSGGEDADLETFSVDGAGYIRARYSDGNTYFLGRLEVARFANPGGLLKLGSNTYGESVNSGGFIAGTAGTPGYGTIRSGFTEMSNVDLANEFTEMIITSRAYQANSRIITTSDEMLQELINLKR